MNVAGRQVTKMNRTDDAVRLISSPLQDVNFALKRPAELLVLRHHPERGPQSPPGRQAHSRLNQAILETVLGLGGQLPRSDRALIIDKCRKAQQTICHAHCASVVGLEFAITPAT